VRADVVVSNADLLLTLERLIGTDHLDPGYLDSIRRLRPTYPCFLTHIGLRDVPDDILRDVRGYYWNTWDSDEAGRGSLKFKLFVPTLYEPEMAPPGCHVVIIQKITEIDYRQIRDWPSHKARLEQYVLENLAALLPGIPEKIEVKMSASALTSHRYTLNHEGSMLGWEMSPHQLGARRPGVISPIENLYFTGHWTQPGGGITPVIVSAMQVAKVVTERATHGIALDEMVACEIAHAQL
jgi:prolycopene isomerase